MSTCQKNLDNSGIRAAFRLLLMMGSSGLLEFGVCRRRRQTAYLSNVRCLLVRCEMYLSKHKMTY